MTILLVSSCSGSKTVDDSNRLTLSDFDAGPAHVAAREGQLARRLTRAEDLYDGLQHRRLMDGIRACHRATSVRPLTIDLRILSAGYGLISGSREIVPYDVTFAGMSKDRLRRWSAQLGVPTSFRQLLAQPYDLCLVLLGSDYLDACDISANLAIGGRTIFLTSQKSASVLARLIPQATLWPLTNSDAKRLRCPLTGAKGEVARRVLVGLSAGTLQNPPWTLDEVRESDTGQGPR
jgi:hypothetical protein